MKKTMNSLTKGRLRRTWALIPLLALASGAWAQTKVANETELKTALSNGGKAVYTASSYLPQVIQNAKASRDCNGVIMLTEDIILSSTININDGDNYTIDLNGHKLAIDDNWDALMQNSDVDAKVIYVDKGGTLTIKDGGKGGLITGGRSDKTNGGAIFNLGTLTVQGGTISGNTAVTDGGAIANYGTLTLCSGVMVKDNMAVNGGAITNYGKMTVQGATICGNKANDHGGGIYNHGTLTILGATIQRNEAGGNGGGMWNEGTVAMQGKVMVNGNGKDDLYLLNGKKIRCTGAFDNASRIGVKMKIHGVNEAFTVNYAIYNKENNHFFLNEDSAFPYYLIFDEKGEVGIETVDKYYECSWDGEKKQVVHTQKAIPEDKEVVNLCSDTFSHGGDLWGDSFWFVVKGKKTIPNGLTCQGKDVHIVLYDDAEVTIEGGLKVKPDTHLHIYSQSYGDNMGKLIAKGSKENAAAIGGNEDYVSGNITIHGGFIEATGASDVAGIGGGDEDKSGFKDIIIYNGIIRAKGGNYAAGIGCGDDNDHYGTVKIYGGDIVATGGKYGAGIGGGEDCRGFDVSIYGGMVKAISDRFACAIGGSESNKGGNLEIEGGTVMAVVALSDTYKDEANKIGGSIFAGMTATFAGAGALVGFGSAGPLGALVGGALGGLAGAFFGGALWLYSAINDSGWHPNPVFMGNYNVSSDMTLYIFEGDDSEKALVNRDVNELSNLCGSYNIIFITGKDVPVDSLHAVKDTKANAFDFEEEETTGIDESLTSHLSPLASEYYTLDGKLIDGKPSQKGIYVVKYTDGTSRKVSIQ